MSLKGENLEIDSTARFERHMEKRCAKLREEILLFQATSLKEHASLCKRLDNETREKRELSRQLAVAHKETRAAKQELQDLTEEKSILLKKLEAANSEFKMNMKTKKSALAELEEALNKIDFLANELETATKEKQVMEEKAKKFKDKYERLRQREKLSDGDNFSELTKYKNSLLRAIFDEKEQDSERAEDFSNVEVSESGGCVVEKHRPKVKKSKSKAARDKINNV